MSPLPRFASVAFRALALLVALGLGACAAQLVPGEHTVPGPGPGGKPMRTGSDAAVGMPAVATTPIYPLTARIEVNDNYFGTKVADPYRWMENLNSPQVHQWVIAENAVSQPQLAALPQRPWLKRRLGELWNYERYDVPVHRGAHYFYLHNDGRQNQSVLFVADSPEASGRVLFDPNAVREDATVAVSDFEPSEQGTVLAYAVSDGGTDWQIWRFRRVTDGTDYPEELRDTKFWGVSWARDGSGVYYSRYPEVSRRQGRRCRAAGGLFPQARHAAGCGSPHLCHPGPDDAHPAGARHRGRALPGHHAGGGDPEERCRAHGPQPPGRPRAAAADGLGCALQLHRLAGR